MGCRAPLEREDPGGGCMVEIGYYLDCEEHGPLDLVRNAGMA